MKLNQSCRVEGCSFLTRSAHGYCIEHRRNSFEQRYQVLKKSARNSGTELKITFNQYKQIVASNLCSYCGGLLGHTGHGLDRMNSNLGYSKKNVVPCCGQCNSLKSDKLSVQETMTLIDTLKKMRQTANVWPTTQNNKQRRKQDGISVSRRKK